MSFGWQPRKVQITTSAPRRIPFETAGSCCGDLESSFAEQVNCLTPVQGICPRRNICPKATYWTLANELAGVRSSSDSDLGFGPVEAAAMRQRQPAGDAGCDRRVLRQKYIAATRGDRKMPQWDGEPGNTRLRTKRQRLSRNQRRAPCRRCPDRLVGLGFVAAQARESVLEVGGPHYGRESLTRPEHACALDLPRTHWRCQHPM